MENEAQPERAVGETPPVGPAVGALRTGQITAQLPEHAHVTGSLGAAAFVGAPVGRLRGLGVAAPLQDHSQVVGTIRVAALVSPPESGLRAAQVVAVLKDSSQEESPFRAAALVSPPVSGLGGFQVTTVLQKPAEPYGCCCTPVCVRQLERRLRSPKIAFLKRVHAKIQERLPLVAAFRPAELSSVTRYTAICHCSRSPSTATYL